jgi:hypothetical protein
VLQNGLIIASISAYWHGVISGGVLIASVSSIASAGCARRESTV